jgi:hypothetical protein
MKHRNSGSEKRSRDHNIHALRGELAGNVVQVMAGYLSVDTAIAGSAEVRSRRSLSRDWGLF